MNADFLDAHHRHWQDAEHLREAARWANADHLYGMAAECGLKRLMLAFGMTVNAQGSPAAKPDWVHADKAWDRFESYRSGHAHGAHYGLPSANPFTDWRAEQRYAPQHLFNEARVQAHRQGVEHVRRLIQRAKTELPGWPA
jgi:hypothetical protein